MPCSPGAAKSATHASCLPTTAWCWTYEERARAARARARDHRLPHLPRAADGLAAAARPTTGVAAKCDGAVVYREPGTRGPGACLRPAVQRCLRRSAARLAR